MRTQLLPACLAATLCLTPVGLEAQSSSTGSPPVCDPGGPYTTTCTGSLSFVQLDGSGSYDPDGDLLWFLWLEISPDAYIDDPTSPSPNLVFSMARACERDVRLALVVTAGGESTRGSTLASSRDSAAPHLDLPPDIQVKRGESLHPTHTGWAAVYDQCNPACSLTWEDEVSASSGGQGIHVIDRSWTGDDGCRRTQGVQRITVVP